MSIIVVNLQDNRSVFRIFVLLLRFSCDSPSYIRIKAGNVCKAWHWGAFVRPLLQWKRIKLYTFWECVCRLMYRVCSFHAPYCHLRPARLYSIFQRLINWTIFWKKKGTEIERCVLTFSTIFVWNICHSKKNWARYYQRLNSFSCSLPVIIVRF